MTHMTMEKKAMTKKKSSDFWSRKVHPRENPGYAYVCERLTVQFSVTAIGIALNQRLRAIIHSDEESHLTDEGMLTCLDLRL